MKTTKFVNVLIKTKLEESKEARDRIYAMGRRVQQKLHTNPFVAFGFAPNSWNSIFTTFKRPYIDAYVMRVFSPLCVYSIVGEIEKQRNDGEQVVSKEHTRIRSSMFRSIRLCLIKLATRIGSSR